MANTVSTDALRPEIWAKELVTDASKNMFFFGKNDGMGGPSGYGLMGPGSNYVIETRNDLKKEHGDVITIPFTANLTGMGVTGDAEMEGQEERITPYSDQVAISLQKNSVRTTGRLDDQKNCFSIRQDAKNKLAIWRAEFLEQIGRASCRERV